MRTPDPNFTPEEADQARAFLREHASPVQQKLFEDGLDEDGRQLYLIVDQFDEHEAAEREGVKAGEEAIYLTSNDELIVDFWRYLTTTAVLPEFIRQLMFPDGQHRFN